VKVKFSRWVFSIFALLLAFAAPAQAERALLKSEAVQAGKAPGGIEGACGIAFGSGKVYVSDYYHHAIDVFLDGSGTYQSRIPFNPLDGPCQLATSASGALYANDWHESASRVLPSSLSFDKAESTGVAVDQATGNLYVNDRSYVAVYEPSGAEVMKIGLGTLGDGYGLAVFNGKLYVPDASDDTVKVYEPALDAVDPQITIDAGFNSLVDAAVAVDPTNGHLLVLDNLQPGFEAPEGAIKEFDPSGTFLGQLAKKVIDAEPSGLAFSGSDLFATSGNSEGAQVLQFGPYVSGGSSSAGEASSPPSSPESQTAAAPPSSGALGSNPLNPLTQAVVIQRSGIKVSFEGKLAPKKLPRHGSAPVRVAVGAKIAAAEGKDPPQLRTISIAINRYGRFDPSGLPICTERDIQPATNQNALKACRGSLVGVGSFSAKVLLSQQSPFPAEGKMYAFNGRLHGRAAILAHVYGTNPVPTSFTFPFELRPSKGTYGTVLRAKLPQATGDSGYITGLSMNLGRNFSFKGKRHSYLTASCPAPKGFSKAVFPLAHAGFFFKGGRRLGSTLVRSCGVRG
jgi:DNA-binding beta-propeller fold protein YncE